nr:MAG: hypothetical protein [Bacteriophage sp.]
MFYVISCTGGSLGLCIPSTRFPALSTVLMLFTLKIIKNLLTNREPFSKFTRCHVSHGIADAVSRLAIVRASVAIRTLTGRLLPRFGFYLL